MSQRTIMHVDLDAFFVSVEQVLNRELKGKPVVVGGNPDHRGVVATASYEARASGLHCGMPLVTAARLCPQAIFIQGNFAKYREASAKFMGILANVVFAGNIGWSDLPIGDAVQLANYIRKLSDLDVELLLPGHMGILRGAERVKDNFRAWCWGFWRPSNAAVF